MVRADFAASIASILQRPKRSFRVGIRRCWQASRLLRSQFAASATTSDLERSVNVVPEFSPYLSGDCCFVLLLAAGEAGGFAFENVLFSVS